MKEKNILCIRVLLDLAVNHGNCLRSSWIYVLESVSKLEYLLSLKSGVQKDSEIFGSNSKKRNENNEIVEILNSENISNNIDQSLIDKIFNRSILLDGDSILDFIICLCKLSM